MTTTYTATARRDGRWWLIEVPQLDVVGQARSLAEADAVAREVIALVLDVDQATVDVTVITELPIEARQAWDASRAKEATARAEGEAAAQLARQAVRRLRADGYTFRDAGLALGLSPQRVHQLATA